MWEVGKYRIREVRKDGVSTYYPQRLMRGFWWTHHWCDFIGADDMPVGFKDYVPARIFLCMHKEEQDKKITKVTYHNVEI